MFAFSVEAPPADGDAPVLLPSLRYARPQGYLRRLARAHGLNVLAIEPGPVRQEQQAEIAGAYVYLTT